MKLTCVTAVFNAIKSGNRENLIRCVESVGALKTEHEHLIYDGASTDGTVELLRELERTTPGVKVVSEPDTGIYNALNKGVRDAKGEWFYVLGCDDYIVDASQIDALLRDEREETSLIVAPVKYDGAYPLFRKLSDLSRILLFFPYSHQSVIMRTGIVRSFGGFDESFKICADWNMLLQCHDRAMQFHYTFTPIAHYSTGGVSERGDLGEQMLIHCRHLRLTERQLRRAESSGVLPLHIVVRFWNHPDLAFRLSARKFLRAWLFNLLRIACWPAVIIRRRIRKNATLWQAEKEVGND